MDLGWLDICIRVNDFQISKRFYETLGFRQVEGEFQSGWGVFVRGQARIALFSPQFMGEESFSLNFRGGNVPEIAEVLAENHFRLEADPYFAGGKAGSLKLRDPDGNLLFIDSAADEIQPN